MYSSSSHQMIVDRDSAGCVLAFPDIAASFTNSAHHLQEQIFVKTVITTCANLNKLANKPPRLIASK